MSNRQVLSTETKSSIPSWLRTPQVVWIVGDLIAAVPSFYLALFIRFGGDLAEAATSVGDIVPRAFLFASLIIAGLFATGMYRTRQRILPMQILTHTAVSVVIGGLLNILVFYIHPPVSTGRGVLLFALCIALFSITLMRRLMAPFTERFVHRRRIVVVGGGRAAQKIAMRRRRADQRRYEVVAYLETTGDLNVYHGAALEHTVSKIDDLYDTEFDEVVLALDVNVDTLLDQFAQQDILGGIDISREYGSYGEHNNLLLICVTETKTEDELSFFAQTLNELIVRIKEGEL